MIHSLKIFYRKKKKKWKLFISVNWHKTIYFNFKKFPFSVAKKLPVYFYGKVKFTSIEGKVVIDSPIKKGMLGFGQPYELTTMSKGNAEIFILGTMVVKGHVQFGKDYFIHIGKDACLEMGHLSSIASNSKIICKNRIVFGSYTRIGSESQVIDTNFHQMFDTITKEYFPMTAPIVLGNYNFISNRVSIMRNTITPNNCTIASNTLCNKDYTEFGEYILIGGIPAKLLRENVSRDWESEKNRLEKYLIIK